MKVKKKRIDERTEDQRPGPNAERVKIDCSFEDAIKKAVNTPAPGKKWKRGKPMKKSMSPTKERSRAPKKKKDHITNFTCIACRIKIPMSELTFNSNGNPICKKHLR